MSNLFAQAASVGPAPLVTFRAGKMYKEGTTVYPDPRKGQVSVIFSASDQLTHFQWKERFSGSTEVDLIIFPEEAKFTKVEKARGGRVFLLDFQHQPERQLFFWMQEPKDDKDAELTEKVNKALNGQATPPTGTGTSGGAGANNAALQGMLSQMMGQMGGNVPQAQTQAAGGQAPAAGGAARGGPDLQALANALTSALGVQVPVPAGSRPAGQQQTQPAQGAGQRQPSAGELQILQNLFAGAGAQQQQQQQQRPQQPQQDPIDLNHVLASPEAQAVIRENAAQLIRELGDDLPARPDDTTGEEHLMASLRSAQFRQTADVLHAALADPAAYHEVTTAFQLPQDPNATGFGVAPFLQRIQRLERTSQAPTQPEGQQQSQQGAEGAPSNTDEKMQE